MHLHSCLVTHLQRSTGSGSICLDSYAVLPPCYSQNYRAPHLYLWVCPSFPTPPSRDSQAFERLRGITAPGDRHLRYDLRATRTLDARRKSRDGRSVSFVLPKKVWTGRNALTVHAHAQAELLSNHPTLNLSFNSLINKSNRRKIQQTQQSVTSFTTTTWLPPA